MVRKLRDARLESRSGRAGVTTLLYKPVGPDVALGYRRGRRSGKWIVRIYTGERTYRTEVIGVADDTVEADGVRILDFWQAVARAQKVAKQRVLPDGAVTGPYKVKDAIKDYLEHLRGRASYDDVRVRLAAYVPPKLGGTDVSKLTRQELTRWHKDIASSPPRVRSKKNGKAKHRLSYDPADPDKVRARKLSANHILGSLKSALNLAFHDERVADDRAWRLVRPFAGVRVARARYLSLPEVTRVLNAAQGDFKTLVTAALTSGCRYGELCRLDVGDFNPDSGTLHVRTSKSGQPRHVILSQEGIDFFAALTAGRDSSAVMIPNTTRSAQRREGDDDLRWRPSEQLRPMAELCKAARIKALGFHQLRHTWASQPSCTACRCRSWRDASGTPTRGWSRSITATSHHPTSPTPFATIRPASASRCRARSSRCAGGRRDRLQALGRQGNGRAQRDQDHADHRGRAKGDPRAGGGE